jgi:hypothetical protein
MNDAPMKQQDATTETPPAELSEPHFDEIAVLSAQPVEPITPRVHNRHWVALMEKPWIILPIVFITAMMGITALALSLQPRDQNHVDTAATEITAATETQAEQTSPEPEPQVGADPEPPKSRPRGTRTSKVRARGNDDNSKPVARRAGVIYGSGADRP